MHAQNACFWHSAPKKKIKGLLLINAVSLLIAIAMLL